MVAVIVVVVEVGGGHCGRLAIIFVVVAVEVVAVVITWPTSLNGGEGHLTARFRAVGVDLRWWARGGGGGGMRENDPKSTVMWLMAV
jgi:hypothetical protein